MKKIAKLLLKEDNSIQIEILIEWSDKNVFEEIECRYRCLGNHFEECSMQALKCGTALCDEKQVLVRELFRRLHELENSKDLVLLDLIDYRNEEVEIFIIDSNCETEQKFSI